MAKDTNHIGEVGLRFFGKMSATVSHEIKNGLAVINENAGLLKDLILMADKGRPLDPARVKSIAEKVLDRVARADHVVQNLNRFAHQVDDPEAAVDLLDTLTLIVALTGRLAANRGKTVRVVPPEPAVRITTNPFALLNLCWCCIEAAMDAAPDKPELTVHIEKRPDGAEIRLSDVDDVDAFSRGLADGVGALLAGHLQTEVAPDAAGRAIVLSLPEKLTPN
ncbi:hypothetical protein [Desulfococcus sp.]|uniref:hypothetical protein n=1 Tax=Desulfococcus sp. TaxID=2025834 RepID=UPI003593A889